jgi:dihydropyrimidinase
MNTDIFSNYINNIKNAKTTQNDEKSKSEVAPYNDNYEFEKIQILKDISNKLDKFDKVSAVLNTVHPIQKNSQVSSENLMDIAIKNGFVVLPEIGVINTDIYIKNGKIYALGNDLEIKAKRLIDANNKYVMPGIIDPHIHLGLFAPLDEELRTETQAALIGGVTTVGSYFASKESHLKTFPGTIEAIGANSYVDVIPHLVISNDDQRKEIIDYTKELGVTSFKIYMNGIPGLIPDVDDGFILDVFDEITKSDKKCIVCAHAENRYMVRRANKLVFEEKGKNATIQDWTDTHPSMAEEEAVERLSYLAEESKVPVYFVHISSKAAIEKLRKIKYSNKYTHVETTSPYLSLTRHSSKTNDIKMEPPFRDDKDVEALWKALEDNVIDSIGTDNVTITKAEKRIDDDIWTTIPGYAVLQTHLPVLLHKGINERNLRLDQFISKMTKKPAEIFGIYPQKGTILPGSDADIVIVDLNFSKKVKANELSSRSDFSIYEGSNLKGWPVMTIKSGKVVVEKGELVELSSQGKCLHR